MFYLIPFACSGRKMTVAPARICCNPFVFGKHKIQSVLLSDRIVRHRKDKFHSKLMKQLHIQNSSNRAKYYFEASKDVKTPIHLVSLQA
jgi:hypothetical protein